MKKRPENAAIDRRKFIKLSGLSSGALCLNPLFANAEKKKEKNKKRLGMALVGLGNYSKGQLGPALLETEHCYLSAIVTGTQSKEKEWQEKYNVPVANTYNYKNFDRIIDNEDIDIVYVVLPNSMHAEFSIRAALAGKHVICEKPMAISTKECQQVIKTCKEKDVKLGIGYRLHYDPFNREMMRLGQGQAYGKVQSIEADFSFKMGDLNQWRADKKMAGGGPLMDIGIYCIQGAIYTLGELPISLSARDTTRDKSAWKSVEGSLEWEMKFASGVIAKSKSSYEDKYFDSIMAKAQKGSFGLSPAYVYGDLKGTTPAGKMVFPEVNQQALQMDAFASNVLNDTEILVPGEMGLRDMFIIEKIYASMDAGGKEVSLKDMPRVLHKPEMILHNVA